MNKLDLLKNKVNNNGQGLAELAVFGSLLLLVFGFLVRYGMQYSYEQQAKMEAYRRALNMAYDSDAGKSQDVLLVKDVAMPNPQDMFGQGDRQSVKASASVFWSNGTGQIDYNSLETSPTIKYIYNPDKKFTAAGSTYTETSGKPTDADLIVKEFTTANITNLISGSVVVGTPLIVKGENIAYTVGQNQAKVYQQEEGYGSKEVMILLKSPGNCNNQYCPKSILDEVRFTRLAPYPVGVRYFPVYNVTGDVGQFPTFIEFLDSEAGQINGTLSNSQTENKISERHNSLILTEDPTVRNSKDILSETETVNHVIITRDGDRSPTFIFKNDIPNSWTTPK